MGNIKLFINAWTYPENQLRLVFNLNVSAYEAQRDLCDSKTLS